MRVRSLTFLLVALFVGIAAFSSAAENGYLEIKEPLLGIEFSGENMKIIVSQCGGTQKNSFRFDLQKNDREQSLTIFRTMADDCKMMPQRETFTFSLAEIGIDHKAPVVVKNSLFADEMFANMEQHNLEREAAQTKVIETPVKSDEEKPAASEGK